MAFVVQKELPKGSGNRYYYSQISERYGPGKNQVKSHTTYLGPVGDPDLDQLVASHHRRKVGIQSAIRSSRLWPLLRHVEAPQSKSALFNSHQLTGAQALRRENRIRDIFAQGEIQRLGNLSTEEGRKTVYPLRKTVRRRASFVLGQNVKPVGFTTTGPRFDKDGNIAGPMSRSREQHQAQPKAPSASRPLIANPKVLARHGADLKRFERDTAAFLGVLRRKGLDTNRLPAIRLRNAGSIGHRFTSLFGRARVAVTLKQKSSLYLVRREIHKASARIGLHAIATQQPDVYERLTLQYGNAFQSWKRSVGAYVKTGNSRNRKFVALAFIRKGNFRALKYTVPNPEKFNVFDSANRKTWEEDFAILYAEIQQKGKTYFDGLAKQKARAKATLATAERKLSTYQRWHPFRYAALRDVNRQLAWLHAIEATEARAQLVTKTLIQ